MKFPFEIIEWRDNQVVMLDQRKLPTAEIYLKFDNYQDVAEAIRNMTVRGAPAIGVAAAMGVAIGVLHSKANSIDALKIEIKSISQTLFETRPTAVNLAWALERLQNFIKNLDTTDLKTFKQEIINEAQTIKKEDVLTNETMGKNGQVLINDGDTVLTHCNAGALATAGFGTAIGVIYAAVDAGKKVNVIADETRPVLQGARLSAWELQKCGVPVTVITDNMAASLMQKGLIHKIIVGADRIARNGDAANKIGTYSVAINAKYHNIPFYVAAPFSTIDHRIKSGKEIPIEERHATEVTHIKDQQIVPTGVAVKNPAFDVTPAELIAGIITEKGILTAPFEPKILELI